ncbi:hypothetical protein QTP88_012960 [Uroleucon formosanum]
MTLLRRGQIVNKSSDFDMKNVRKSIDNYDRDLNNYNVTTHDVSAMAAIKISYDFIYSTLEKILNKGAAPSNSIHLNGSHQLRKCKLRHLIENSTHVTWQRFVDDSSPLPVSEPSNTTVSQEKP